MRLHYKGSYNGDPNTLPHDEHPEGAVKFREPEDAAGMAKVASFISIAILFVELAIYLVVALKTGFFFTSVDFIVGIILAYVGLVPHEFLHAICFREDVYLYTMLRKGMLFVACTEPLSKGRFVFMSLLPTLVLGVLPLTLCILMPSLSFLGWMGMMAIPMGAGDFLNVFNCIRQVPKGGLTYMHKFNSYWYMPQ